MTTVYNLKEYKKYHRLLSNTRYMHVRLIKENLCLLENIFETKRELKQVRNKNLTMEVLLGLSRNRRLGMKSLVIACQKSADIRARYIAEFEFLKDLLETLYKEQQRLMLLYQKELNKSEINQYKEVKSDMNVDDTSNINIFVIK